MFLTSLFVPLGFLVQSTNLPQKIVVPRYPEPVSTELCFIKLLRTSGDT